MEKVQIITWLQAHVVNSTHNHVLQRENTNNLLEWLFINRETENRYRNFFFIQLGACVANFLLLPKEFCFFITHKTFWF